MPLQKVAFLPGRYICKRNILACILVPASKTSNLSIRIFHRNRLNIIAVNMLLLLMSNVEIVYILPKKGYINLFCS